jgi:transcriptional regulator with XRE-family HTH domain
MISLQVALGRAIRRLREDQEISQEKFAAKAGLDRTYQTSVETGRRNVSLHTIELIATALGIDTGVLLAAAELERRASAKIERKPASRSR